MVLIPEAALSWTWLRAGGPGGQHQNKTESAVQLRYDISQGELTPEVMERLRKLAGNRLTDSDEIIIEAREHRSREMNRRAALDKLTALIEEAQKAPLKRKKSKPTLASIKKRLSRKREHSMKKKARRKPEVTDD